ncbi:unnamed protein product [Caenorhabditis auriculariae]|uniref:DUF5009 domain-containing protein n=1 Tax=Caenorhabditis auriculariae TaxID=2777116 RepID=A0A8S1H0D9_9PELO|nr:unnamed protein product [Caenorhabditis auriculariae]
MKLQMSSFSFGCFPATTELSFKPDTAIVNVIAAPGAELIVNQLDCKNCSASLTCAFGENHAIKALFNTTGDSAYRVISKNGSELAHGTASLSHMGTYEISQTGLKVLENGDYTRYFSYPLVILFFLAFFYPYLRQRIGLAARRYLARRDENYSRIEDSEIIYNEEFPNHMQNKTYVLVHVLRGVALLLMMFVNAGGAGMGIFQHSIWDGLTVADWVFPFFLFLFGASMSISWNVIYGRFLSWDFRPHARHVFRMTELFFIGFLIVNTTDEPNNWGNVRIFGVLQRFALCGLIVHFAHVALYRSSYEGHKGNTERAINRCVICYPTVRRTFWDDLFCVPDSNLVPNDENANKNWVRLIQFRMVAFFLVLGIIATVLQKTLTVPGCPMGYMGPGGLIEQGEFFNCTGGITSFIDSFVLGQNHMYSNPTCKTLYQCPGSFDPEGLFTTLLAAYNVFMGYQAAIFLMFSSNSMEFLQSSSLFTISNAVLGIVLHFTILPANKNLWTLSFALLTTGISMGVFSTISYVIYNHPQQEYRYYPKSLHYMGLYSLEIYVFSTFLEGRVPVVVSYLKPYFIQQALSSILLCLFFMFYAFYRHYRAALFIVPRRGEYTRDW